MFLWGVILGQMHTQLRVCLEAHSVPVFPSKGMMGVDRRLRWVREIPFPSWEIPAALTHTRSTDRSIDWLIDCADISCFLQRDWDVMNWLLISCVREVTHTHTIWSFRRFTVCVELQSSLCNKDEMQLWRFFLWCFVSGVSVFFASDRCTDVEVTGTKGSYSGRICCERSVQSFMLLPVTWLPVLPGVFQLFVLLRALTSL